MLEYAEKLTQTPAAITKEDIDRLRGVGWDDRDILDIVHVSAYFNFRVRMVDGLGLEVSDESAQRAVDAREHAAILGKEKGVALPADIWDVAGQAKQARETTPASR